MGHATVTDLVVVSATVPPSKISVWLGNGDGTFRQVGSSFPSFAITSVAVGDFNNDGKPDLGLIDQNGGVAVQLGNGDGTFQSEALCDRVQMRRCWHGARLS